MDNFVKPIKPTGPIAIKSTKTRIHPYKSKQDILKEKCCTPRPAGNIFTSSITGHQVSEGAGDRATSYFVSRNQKLAHQFRDPQNPLADATNTPPPGEPEIFRNCVVYINGYMGPLISDIELKKRLARHGARVVTNFGRKSVTHVILGPNGLAGGKIQKEMLAKKVGVKYVTVDWYCFHETFNCRALDSLKEGKRMVEAKYAIVRHEVDPADACANLETRKHV
jgi:twin BRCT domain